MSTFLRKLVFALIGLLGGLAAWPIAEVILARQSEFPSFLIFTVTLGAVIGAIMGAFLGSGEGITLSIGSKIVPGIITGGLVGVIGGALGFLIGQGALFFISETVIHSNEALQSIGIPISRVIGWAFLGLFIGMVEGIRALSLTKIRVGMLGGLIGGILGGVALEYLKIRFPDFIFARLVGLVILGTLIGLFYGLFEKGMAQGVFKLLNGKLKGKEYLLVQRKIRVGSSGKADIRLSGYKDIADIHAILTVKKDAVTIRKGPSKNRILINEVKTDQHLLKFEDVVQIGSAKFLFFYK